MRAQCGVGSGEQTLGAGFFVTGGAVDLPGEEQTADHFGFQAVLQVARIEVVVLDGVARAHDVCVFHAADRLHDLQLHIERQGCGYPVRVQLVRGQTFRFDEDLVAFLVGKAMNLVFDRRAVTRTDAFDLACIGIHRRTVEVRRNDLVGTGVGMSNPATDLPWMLLFGTHERHHRDRRIAGLLGHHREIHRTGVDTRRRTGLQATDPQRQFT
ncbi:hypothetical protein D3C81_1589900 [compost metagenome]